MFEPNTCADCKQGLTRPSSPAVILPEETFCPSCARERRKFEERYNRPKASVHEIEVCLGLLTQHVSTLEDHELDDLVHLEPEIAEFLHKAMEALGGRVKRERDYRARRRELEKLTDLELKRIVDAPPVVVEDDGRYDYDPMSGESDVSPQSVIDRGIASDILQARANQVPF